jgi:hypothetical protein
MILTTFGSANVACAQDPIESWTDSTYKKKKYKKIMVIAPFTPPTYRKRFEIALVDGLKDRRIKAFSSTEIITNEDLLDTVLLLQKIKDSKADGIVVLIFWSSKPQNRFILQAYLYLWNGLYKLRSETRKVSAGLIQLILYSSIKGPKYRSGVII